MFNRINDKPNLKYSVLLTNKYTMAPLPLDSQVLCFSEKQPPPPPPWSTDWLILLLCLYLATVSPKHQLLVDLKKKAKRSNNALL